MKKEQVKTRRTYALMDVFLQKDTKNEVTQKHQSRIDAAGVAIPSGNFTFSQRAGDGKSDYLLIRGQSGEVDHAGCVQSVD